MAWLTSCDGTNSIVTQGGSWAEFRYSLVGSGGIGGMQTISTYKSVHTPTVTEYVGVTLATAQNYCSSNPATATYASGVWTVREAATYARSNDAGAYTVTVKSETITDFAVVPDSTPP